MNSRVGWTLLTVVSIIIVVSAVFLIVTPAPTQAPTKEMLGTGKGPFVSENVKVSAPLPGAKVSRTFTISGEARGQWYFEASFPVQVRDSNNNLIAQSHAEAKSDWMTTDWVPFTSTIAVQNYSGPATLVLLKDNPSGLPENEDAVEFSITIQ